MVGVLVLAGLSEVLYRAAVRAAETNTADRITGVQVLIGVFGFACVLVSAPLAARQLGRSPVAALTAVPLIAFAVLLGGPLALLLFGAVALVAGVLTKHLDDRHVAPLGAGLLALLGYALAGVLGALAAATVGVAAVAIVRLRRGRVSR